MEAAVIPSSRNNDGVPRHKIAIITKDGFKGNGYVDWEEDELLALISGWSAESLSADNKAWLLIRTVAYEESDPRGKLQFNTEILCVKREHISAWAISPVKQDARIAVVRGTLVKQ